MGCRNGYCFFEASSCCFRAFSKSGFFGFWSRFQVHGLTDHKKTSFGKGLILSFCSLLIFFALLEGGLALFGVKPQVAEEDPFVGFSSNIPLFVEEERANGQVYMTTADNKLTFFNRQSFPLQKPSDAYRIFCLGGSTTYGRPYNDTTSFAGWLRDLLPAVDTGKRWEVINAGGISYASYRVAHLMEELATYEPDLFIVYTGHNEFLEERTYGEMRDMPAPVKWTASILSRTRTWTAMSSALEKAGALPETKMTQRDQLSGEVNEILTRSAGPERYQRDNELQQKVIRHYQLSLERMVDIARSSGAQIVFVTPASNLKDCAPFKSQHAAQSSPQVRRQVEDLLTSAEKAEEKGHWRQALQLTDQAVKLAPLYAEANFLRGEALFGLQWYEEAEQAYRRARDEDVCPLRALTPMLDVLAEVAEAENVPLVDYADLLRRSMTSNEGHAIPGEEFFLDHVHPTVGGHRLLAVQLVESLSEMDILIPEAGWRKDIVPRVTKRIEGRIDRETHAQALANLARVLSWAGKEEDAASLARRVLASEVENPQIIADAASILGSIYHGQGQPDKARTYFLQVLEAEPANPEVHLQLAFSLLNDKALVKATGHLLLAKTLMPENDLAHQVFGLTMAERERFRLAYASLEKALDINPGNTEAEAARERLRSILGLQALNLKDPQAQFQPYPSGAPEKILQVLPTPEGQEVRHGIYTEWYPDGRLKRFTDYSRGVRDGLDITWGPGGELISRTRYRRGAPLVAPTNHVEQAQRSKAP